MKSISVSLPISLMLRRTKILVRSSDLTREGLKQKIALSILKRRDPQITNLRRVALMLMDQPTPKPFDEKGAQVREEDEKKPSDIAHLTNLRGDRGHKEEVNANQLLLAAFPELLGDEDEKSLPVTPSPQPRRCYEMKVVSPAVPPLLPEEVGEPVAQETKEQIIGRLRFLVRASLKTVEDRRIASQLTIELLDNYLTEEEKLTAPVIIERLFEFISENKVEKGKEIVLKMIMGLWYSQREGWVAPIQLSADEERENLLKKMAEKIDHNKLKAPEYRLAALRLTELLLKTKETKNEIGWQISLKMFSGLVEFDRVEHKKAALRMLLLATDPGGIDLFIADRIGNKREKDLVRAVSALSKKEWQAIVSRLSLASLKRLFRAFNQELGGEFLSIIGKEKRHELIGTFEEEDAIWLSAVLKANPPLFWELRGADVWSTFEKIYNYEAAYRKNGEFFLGYCQSMLIAMPQGDFKHAVNSLTVEKFCFVFEFLLDDLGRLAVFQKLSDELKLECYKKVEKEGGAKLLAYSLPTQELGEFFELLGGKGNGENGRRRTITMVVADTLSTDKCKAFLVALTKDKKVFRLALEKLLSSSARESVLGYAGLIQEKAPELFAELFAGEQPVEDAEHAVL